MSTDEQATPASGSVPLAYGNALAWKWVPAMPVALRRSHLHTLLYALRAMASASGELRFADHKPIRIQDIARAAGADEKDTRDRLEAAIRAGVVTVKGERRRGVRALYVLVLAPRPDWPAAVAYLDGVKQLREEARQRREADRKAAPWTEDDTKKNGGRSPELDDAENGGPPPELTGGTAEEERGTAPRMSSGDRPLNGSGDRPPNNPGVSHGSSQERVGARFQPQVVGRSGEQIDSPEDQDNPDTWTRCTECRRPILPDPQRPGRTVHARCETPAIRAERHSA